ncbi:MAG: class I SAM-dependent methyltransferase [Candidatus Nanoarchaeia archaeon]|nr:class I SAM-dependent methyltransferase [Candidatus Nanoarchaeia archaeon]
MPEYEKEYHESFHSRLLNDKQYYMFRAKYANKTYWEFFKGLNGKFIEFGSGIGQNIFLHKDKTIGIDISKFARKECENRGIETKAGIKEIKSSSLNGILCLHVLEHLEEPLKTLKEFSRVLKKEGRLVLVVPYLTHTKLPSDLSAGHLYGWTFASLETLLDRAGFKVIHRQFEYASGFSVFRRLPFRLALICIKFLGMIKNKREIVLVAEKY